MAMKPNQFKEFLKKSLVEMPHRPIFVKGPVGVGKSDTVSQVVEELGWEFDDVRLSLLDATDMRGLPAIDKEKRETIWTKPEFLPRENDNKDRLLFFDEWNTAPKSMQNALLSLMLGRQIGEYKLPSRTRVAAAGNRIEDVGSFVSKQTPALNNRGIHIEFQTDFNDWKQWAIKNRMHPMVMGYLQWKQGEGLHRFKEDVDTDAFPTPRTWSFLGLPEVEIEKGLTQSGVLYLGLDNGILAEAVKGTIGQGEGLEFMGYWKLYKSLPDPKDILLKGKDIIPKEGNVMFALCASLVHLVRDHQDKINRLVEYSMKVEKEFSVVLIKDMLKTDMKDKLMSCKAFDEYVKMNKEIIIG